MKLKGGRGQWVALGILAIGSSLCRPAHAAADVADMDISELVELRVSPFDVAQHLDRGYRASNAVTRC